AINFQGDDYEVSVKDFAAGNFIGSLATAAGVNLNDDIKNALEGIGKFDLAISNDKFSLNSSENSNINIAELFPDNSSIKGFLEDIEPALILSDLEFSYEVDENNQTNLSLSSKIGEGDDITDVAINFQGDDYEVSVKDFAAGNFIGSLATAAGVNLNDDIKNALEGIGKFDLAISPDELSLKSTETITIDLLEIASIDTPVDAIDDAINNTVKDALGDTNLILKEPELAYSFTDKKLTLATEIGEGENQDRVSLEFGKDFDVKLEYKLGEELSLGSLVSVDELNNVSFEDLTFIAANYTDIELKEFVEGFNFSGEFNFQDGDDIISKFFRDELKILKLDADLQVGERVNLAANAETDWNLIGEGKDDFTVTLSQIGLGLKIDGITPEIGIDGTLKLKNYDPSQDNEPELSLMGGLSVDPSSLNAQFALDTGSNQAWTNPFGLTGVELRDFGIQAGIGPSGLDNFGIRGDLK
ncbi:MAG: hypothetical protein SWJ54_25620, partial [Cyanobacteriota bacterium]|nr:hypothetical protein [Cyanobacteriota bacterium]